MVYDQAKQAVGLKDKWRNHHVPDAFASAWRQAVKATRDEYVKEFSHHLGGSMEEAIREATNALSRPDFLDGWLKQTAAFGGFDLGGSFAASWDDQVPERAKALTVVFRQHMPILSVTLRNVPESFYEFWEGAFLHKLMYFFIEAAVKDDPRAWAQIQFNIHRSQCRMLAAINQDTAAIRAMTRPLALIAEEMERRASAPQMLSGCWYYHLDNLVSGARVVGAFELSLSGSELVVPRGIALYAIEPPGTFIERGVWSSRSVNITGGTLYVVYVVRSTTSHPLAGTATEYTGLFQLTQTDSGVLHGTYEDLGDRHGHRGRVTAIKSKCDTLDGALLEGKACHR